MAGGNESKDMAVLFILETIKNIVASAGLDESWWTGITIAAMLCLFLVIQSVVIAQKKKARR